MPRAPQRSLPGHVRINGAVFYAFHGVSRGERVLGAQYEIDIDVFGDLAKAARTDRLEHAFNYEAIYARVQAIVVKKPYALMETIAAKIIDDLFGAYAAAEEVGVHIRKLNAPIKGVVRSAEVTLTVARDNWKARR